MAQNKYALARYSLIDQILRRNEYVKTIHIVESCRNKLGCQISQRTIQLDIEAMKHDSFLGYYAPIDYCRTRKAYYYTDPHYLLQPLQFSEEEKLLLLKALTHLHRELPEPEREYELVESILHKIRLSNS